MKSKTNKEKNELLKEFLENSSPEILYKKLIKRVIGQDDAARALSIVAFKHIINISRSNRSKKVIKKPNAILVGPSGSGKTFLLENLADLLNLPMIHVDTSRITLNGYVGTSLDSIGEKLLAKAGGNLQKASKGIVFLDEIDKTIKSDLEVKDIQGELLKMLESTDLETSEGVLNTKDVLFISGGVFKGAQFPKEKKEVGFVSKGKTKAVDKPNVLVDALMKYGLSPEFLGRFPTVIALNKLSEETLGKILSHKVIGPFSDFRDVLSIMGKKLVIPVAARKLIVKKAAQYDTGARSLHSVASRLLDEFYFSGLNTKKKTFNITVNQVNNILGA